MAHRITSQRPATPQRAGRTARTTALAAAGALLVSATAAWQLWPQPAAPVPAAAPVYMRTVLPADGTARAPAPVGVLADDPDARFELTPDGHLVPNGALLDALNAGLARAGEGEGEGGNAALRRRLAVRLAPPALDEAMRLAAAYRAYARAHDDLLAAHNLRLPASMPTPSDLARLSTWREQRARLRARMLDKAAVQAWYADDDLQLAQAIDELQRSGEADDTSAGAQAGTQAGAQANARAQAAAAGGVPYRPVPRFLDKAEQARHQGYLTGLLAKATTPLVAVRDGQAQR